MPVTEDRAHADVLVRLPSMSAMTFCLRSRDAESQNIHKMTTKQENKHKDNNYSEGRGDGDSGSSTDNDKG